MVFATLWAGMQALMLHREGKGPGVDRWVQAGWWGPSVLTGSLSFKYKRLLGEQSQDCMTLSPVLLSLQRKILLPRKRKNLPRSHTPSENNPGQKPRPLPSPHTPGCSCSLKSQKAPLPQVACDASVLACRNSPSTLGTFPLLCLL